MQVRCETVVGVYPHAIVCVYSVVHDVPAPQKAISALPSLMRSMPVPIQWAPVEHADEMEYDGPCVLNAVHNTAEHVDPMDRVTRNGPTLFFHRFPPSCTASTVSTISGIEVPPCPIMVATRGFSS